MFFVLAAFAALVAASPADSADVMDMDVAASHHKKVYKPKVKYVAPKVKYVKVPVQKVVYKKHHG